MCVQFFLDSFCSYLDNYLRNICVPSVKSPISFRKNIYVVCVHQLMQFLCSPIGYYRSWCLPFESNGFLEKLKQKDEKKLDLNRFNLFEARLDTWTVLNVYLYVVKQTICSINYSFYEMCHAQSEIC